MALDYELKTTAMSGNMHSVADTLNKCGVADYVIQIDSNGRNSNVLFKIPKESIKHNVRVKEFFKL